MSRGRRRSTDLQSIPGVGPSIAKDLRDLGYERVADLRGADPQQMFDALCDMRDERIDRCVLYVFRCAVYFAQRKRHDPELLKWWNWKDAERPARRRARRRFAARPGSTHPGEDRGAMNSK